MKFKDFKEFFKDVATLFFLNGSQPYLQERVLASIFPGVESGPAMEAWSSSDNESQSLVQNLNKNLK